MLLNKRVVDPEVFEGRFRIRCSLGRIWIRVNSIRIRNYALFYRDNISITLIFILKEKTRKSVNFIRSKYGNVPNVPRVPV